METAFINVSMVYQDQLVALFVFATGSFPTPQCAAEKQDFRVGLFSIEDFSLPIDCMPITHLSQSKNCSFSLEGFHSNDPNVTFVCLQVSMSRTEVFGFHVRVHGCSVYNMKYQEQRHKTGGLWDCLF